MTMPIQQSGAANPRYVSKSADASGRVAYTEAENAIWAELYARQEVAIRGKACDAFLYGLDVLALPRDRVPQLAEVSAALRRETGWEVAAVPALIPIRDFFELLANRRFPAATFVRRREELNYLQEPDIFHEIFGHTPMLTNPYFADFTAAYGKIGLSASEEDQTFLERLYWFTVEFGLMQKSDGPLQIYGGGILSSIGETEYAINSLQPKRRKFDLSEALRTPYRIDIMQPLYYVIEDLRELFELTRMDLIGAIQSAKKLPLLPPLFEPKTKAA